MKPLSLILAFACLILFNPDESAYGQIVRGSSPGEIYIRSSWCSGYPYYIQEWTAIIRSADNGNTITIQDSLAYGDPWGGSDFQSDAAEGKLYLIRTSGDSTKKSNDFGHTWIQFSPSPKIEGHEYASGCSNGEIYVQTGDELNPGLFRSSDYGSTYIGMNPIFNITNYQPA